jgi:hypothetical protein
MPWRRARRARVARALLHSMPVDARLTSIPAGRQVTKQPQNQDCRWGSNNLDRPPAPRESTDIGTVLGEISELLILRLALR